MPIDQVDPVALSQPNPQTRAIVAGQYKPTTPASQMPVGGTTAPNTEVTRETPNLTQSNTTTDTVSQNEAQATPTFDKSKLGETARKELSDPDLPYAKAAAWNAFFGNILRKPGGQSGGMPDAIAAYANTYGRALQKLSDDEVAYESQKNIINKGATDTINNKLNRFETGNEFIDNVVKGSKGDLKTLQTLEGRLKESGDLEGAQKLQGLIEEVRGVEQERADSLLQAAQFSGGKVKATENGEINGQSVTKIVMENGKVIYKDANGKTLKDVKGFKSEKQLEGEANRAQRAEDKAADRQLKELIANASIAAQQGNRDLQAIILNQKIQENAEKRQDAINNAVNNADRGTEQVDKVLNHKGRSLLGAYDPKRMIPGTDSYDFIQSINQLKSGAFLQGVQQMRGLGALSNAEGAKVETAVANLNPNMSKAQFNEELNKIKKSLQIMKDDALKKQSAGFAGATGATATGAINQPVGGTTANEPRDASTLPGAPK